MSTVHFAIRGPSIEESLGVALTRELVIATDRCWLCGAVLSTTKSSKDHIFNTWLLNWRGLHDEKITLSNGSLLPFRQARVGTCNDCNSVHLSRIEGRVAGAAKAGLRDFAALAPQDVLLWLAKMHFALLRLELRLKRDLKSRDSGTIVSDDFFRGPLRLEHLLLQAARGRVRADPSPGSVLLFEVEPGPGHDFDYSDMIDPMFIALRMGSIGVVANLQDWGWLEETWAQLAQGPDPVVTPVGSRVSTEAFFDITTTAMVLARSLRGAPQVLVDNDDNGTIVVQPLPVMTPLIDMAAKADDAGQPLPAGFRPWMNQILDVQELANLDEAVQARRARRVHERRRRSE
jgi:hypothetical protein